MPRPAGEGGTLVVCLGLPGREGGRDIGSMPRPAGEGGRGGTLVLLFIPRPAGEGGREGHW